MKKLYLALVLATVAQLCHAQFYRRWHFIDPTNNPHSLRSTAVKLYDAQPASGTVGSMIIGTPEDMQGSIPYLSVSETQDAFPYYGDDYFYDFGQTFGPNFTSIDIRNNLPVITGYITDDHGTNHLLVMRTSADGNVLWGHSYHFHDQPSQGLDVIYSDDYILVTGFLGEAERGRQERNFNKKILVMKLDMNGTVIWQRILRSTLSYEDTRFDMGNDIEELDKGKIRDPKLPPVSFRKRYLLTGTVTDSDGEGIYKRPIVFCLDDEGTLLWSNMPKDEEYAEHYYDDNSIGTVFSKHPSEDLEEADEGIVYYSFNHGNYGPVITTVSPLTGLINDPSQYGYFIANYQSQFFNIPFTTLSGLTLKGGANEVSENYLYLAAVSVDPEPDYLYMQTFRLVFDKTNNTFPVFNAQDAHTTPSSNYFTSRYGDIFDIFWEPYNPSSKHSFIHSPKVMDVSRYYSAMVTGVDHYTPSLSHELNLFGMSMDEYYYNTCTPFSFPQYANIVALSDHPYVLEPAEEYEILGVSHLIEKISIEPQLWDNCSHPEGAFAKKENDVPGQSMKRMLSVNVHSSNGPVNCEISVSETGQTFSSKIMVINMLGQTVYSNDHFELSPNIRSIDLPLQGLATGIYNLVISAGNKTVVKKFRIDR